MRQNADTIARLFPTPYAALKLLFVSPVASSPPCCTLNRNAATLCHAPCTARSQPSVSHPMHYATPTAGATREGMEKVGPIPGVFQDRNEELGYRE